MNASPVGFKARCFRGYVSQVQVLNVGVPDVGFKPFTPQGEAPGFEFTPNCGLPCCQWVYGGIVSQPLLPASVWFFLFLFFFHLPSV